ncbi:MAG: oligoribonuclease [Salinibacterium sp.]|nr:oligoribonuclease [Salinibacterium sp.]
MSNSALTMSHGDTYVVFYTGGPYDGRTDSRISTDGSWDKELTVIAAMNGKETQLVYVSPVAELVGEEVHVTYTWDQHHSDPLQALDERDEMNGADR